MRGPRVSSESWSEGVEAARSRMCSKHTGPVDSLFT
ncbi:hypothetical protein WG66_002527 [Moniliophthora roreri]|nr:hypothetical protein WG66_002527 [Moniliophthora roreri]